MKTRQLLLASTLLGLLGPTGQAASTGLPLNSAKGIRCHLEKVNDAASGLVAFTFMVPDGWTPHSFFKWTDPGAFSASLSASTPDKHYSVNQLQRMVVSYSIFKNPTNGQIVSSKGNVIHQATDFLRALVEGLKRQYNVDEVQVVDEINAPLPASQIGIAGTQSRSDLITDYHPLNQAGFLEVKFEKDGIPMVGAFGTSLTGMLSEKHLPNRPDQQTSEGGVFAVGPTTIVVAPESPSKQQAKELALITSSMAPTVKFMVYLRALQTRLMKIKIGSDIEGTKYLDATFHERSMAAFRGQIEHKDQLSRQFCNYIQDRQDYKDPSGAVVTLPSSFNHAWADGEGHYILSDDPTTDPRGYGGGKWEEMGKYRPGN